jgi:baculoviral IAP repeat-containing protein 6
MKPLQFNNTYIIPKNHSFYNKINHKIESSTMIRLLTEYQSIKNTLPLNWESSIWCFTSNKHYNISTFLISGPKDTPYENGLFEFHVYFPSNYPIQPPNIIFNTTGIPKGTFRFNPNLYNNGKVCLSLLGTWDGYESEKWNPKTSTFLQILISIQSLIFIENPYFNEPGWESNLNTEIGNKKSKQYNNNIYPKTIEYAMIDMIKNPIYGFEEIIKNHFKYKKNEILEKIKQLMTDIDLSKLINELELILE